jgi:hypothetical protein
MARLARKELADMRAMEEQNARVTMRGRGAIVGAGATPSMGLSQFRGGGDMDDSSSDEDECKCKMCGGAISIMPARGAPSGYSARILPDAPSTAITPYRPVRAPPKPPSALVPVGALGRPVAKPSMPQSYYANLFKPKPTAPAAKKTVLTASQKANIARLLAAGIPLAALGAYLGDAVAQSAADSGYYDDYVEPEIGTTPLADPRVIVDNFPVEPKIPYVDGVPLAPTENMPKMTKKEIKFYLQSGNLPDRFYSDYVPRKGSGRSDGRSNRAEVVRKVMREKGMKLIEASKYVKEHGLYKK